MNPWRPVIQGAALFCAVLLAIQPTVVRAQPTEGGPPAAAQEARELLVMLRLPADHLRPGSSYGKGYDDRSTSRARLRTARDIARRHQLDLVGNGWPMLLLGVDCYVMRVPPGRSVEAAVAELARDPMVTWSQPMQTYRAPGREEGSLTSASAPA